MRRAARASPASETVEVVHRHAADRAFTREVATTSRTCPISDVNCWTTYRPAGTFYGRYYWQVSLAGAVQASSQTFLFTAIGQRKAVTAGPACRSSPEPVGGAPSPSSRRASPTTRVRFASRPS
jgi:hypothetical protein